MFFFYALLIVYILAVNFYAFRFVKAQRDGVESGDDPVGRGDGKLILAALLGGAATIYICMFAMRYRLGSILLMLSLPLLAVFNFYCFFLGFRGIYLFF